VVHVYDWTKIHPVCKSYRTLSLHNIIDPKVQAKNEHYKARIEAEPNHKFHVVPVLSEGGNTPEIVELARMLAFSSDFRVTQEEVLRAVNVAVQQGNGRVCSELHLSSKVRVSRNQGRVNDYLATHAEV
jgi:hypothetical protein